MPEDSPVPPVDTLQRAAAIELDQPEAAVELYRQAAVALRDTAPVTAALALHRAARVYQMLDRRAEAQADLRRAAGWLASTDRPDALAVVLFDLATAEEHGGDLIAAHATFERALAAARASGDGALIGHVQAGLGRVLTALERPEARMTLSASAAALGSAAEAEFRAVLDEIADLLRRHSPPPTDATHR